MLGGRIIGEGVDGCVMSEPMWPCISGSKDIPISSDTKYVSKLVSKTDKESEFLRTAARILGPELSSKYLANLGGECKPANASHPPNSKNLKALKESELYVRDWKRKGLACDTLKQKINKKATLSDNSKVMFIAKYPMTVDDWAKKLMTERTSYKRITVEVEYAIPQLLVVLQKFYQDADEELLNIDLHTGNIFVKFNPLEFGIADFGNCVFRRYSEDPSKTFFGKYLIDFVFKFEYYSGYSQIPLESRIMNYCFKKNLENVNPLMLIKLWENDESVRMYAAGSKDVIIAKRSVLLEYLLKKVLFIAMIESIQSICRKLRKTTDPTKLYESMTSIEKTVVDFILTRYMIISPINTITQQIMNVYHTEPLNSKLVTYIMRATSAPYEQDGSLEKVLINIKSADFGILWKDIVRGLVE
jgi:hypothetical protein